MHRESLSLVGSGGGTLAASLDLPDEPARAFAVFAHCFTCGKDLAASSRVAKALTRHGIGVMRVDFTGLGESSGEFVRTDFDTNIEDILVAADWLAVNRTAPTLLIGHSLGGAAVIAAARYVPTATAVATIGAPFDLRHLEELFAAQIPDIEHRGSAPVCIAGREFDIGQQLIDTLRTTNATRNASELGRPLLILHSPTDEVVPFEHARRLEESAGPTASRVALNGSDHLLTRPGDIDYVADVVATWAQPFLGDAAPAAPVPSLNGAMVVVAETTQGRLLNRADTADHHLLVDEPVELGGFNAAPSPIGLLMSALAGCTSITMRLYADRKGFPLERAIVRVDEASDAEGNTVFRRAIELEGPLDDEQRRRILAIAERCPIHRAVTRPITVITAEGPELPAIEATA